MSSLGGLISSGSRSRNRSTVSIVSSTESVVCESHTTFSSGPISTWSACSGPSISVIASGASPVVPTTSSCPS